MSAWQNAGMFEGKKVTDAMVLAHWNERLQGVDKADPTYDDLHNKLMVVDYTIHWSKEQTIYDQSPQGAADDARMANFYLGWAKKIPKNSEFYRTLQKDAAQFMQSSASKGRAGAAKAKTDAYNAFQADITKRYIAPSDVLTGVMTQVARDNNLIGQDQTLADFALRGQDDPGRMENLLSLINGDMAANPAKYAGIVASMKAADPGFDGNLTSAYFARTLTNRVKGFDLIQKRATTDGYTSNANAAGKQIDAANTLGGQVRSWPVAATYSTARAQFDAVWNSPAATDADKAIAAERLATSIDSMAALSGLPANMANALVNDARALRGDPGAANQSSFFENYLGNASSMGSLATGSTTSEGGSVSGENAKFGTDIARINFWKAQHDANPGAYVYAPYKLDGQNNPVFDPTGTGPVGIVPIGSVSSAPGANSIIPVPTITGGSIMQVVNQKDVVMDDPYGGKPIVVGTSMTYNAGGITRTLYGVKRPDGTTDWTPVAPWAPGVSETIKPDGIHLSINPSLVPKGDPAATATAIDASPGFNGQTNISGAFAGGAVPADGAQWKVRGVDVAKGQAGQRVDYVVTWKGGQFVTSNVTSTIDATGTVVSSVESGSQVVNPLPQVSINDAWDQSRLAAGPNPTIDFTMPIMAALSTSQITGMAVADAWQSPVFQAQLQAQEAALAGNDPVQLAKLGAVDRGIALNLVNFGPEATVQWPGARDAAAFRASLITPRGQPPITSPAISVGTTLKLPNVDIAFPTGEMPGAGNRLLDAAGKMVQGMSIAPTPVANPAFASPTAAPFTPPTIAPVVPFTGPTPLSNPAFASPSASPLVPVAGVMTPKMPSLGSKPVRV